MNKTTKVLNNVTKNIIPKIQRDISTIITNNTATKNIVANISSFKDTLNQHIITNDNLFSLDNVNSLSNVYVKCMNKLNFTLSCIQKYTTNIKLANEYASILKPIFENKFTDNNISNDGYVYIQRIIPTTDVNSTTMRKKIYFFEADSNQNNRLTYSDSNLEQLSQNSMTNLCVNKFNLLRSLNPSQQLFHFVHLHNWALGSKVSFVAIIPDLLDNIDGNKWIVIGSGVNITPKFTNYGTISQLPSAYVDYLYNIQLNFIKFCIPSYDPYSEGTIYQFGQNFDTLKVVNSIEYPLDWNGKLIKNCYINGSNINMPLVVSQINDGIITEYTGVSRGQNVLVDYVVGNDFYTGVIKILNIEDYGLCFHLLPINKSEIFKTSVAIIGDTEIQGNLNVVNYSNEPIVYTDNTRKITCFNDKVGINQSPFEVQGLLDIDNLTQQTVLDMMAEFEQTSIKSYNITQIILDKLNSLSITSEDDIKEEIATLFNAGNDLYSYTAQCSIISSQIKPIIATTELKVLYNALTSTLLSERTFKRIQQNVKEINQMNTEYSNMTTTEKNNFVFSFFELMPNASQRWFLMSIRGFISNNRVIAVLTQLEVTNIMIDKSYATYLFNITDYISRLYRSINFKHILLKNPSVYTNGVLDVTKYEQYIQNNDYFSNNFDLLPESYMYVFNKTTNYYVYHGLNHSWINNDPYNCWLESKNAGESVTSIKQQIKTIYNDTFNYVNPSIYIWDSKKTFAFTILSKINGLDCVIGCGFNISSLLNRSMVVKGDNKISGNFEVDDWNNNVIFKVDNVEKTITNSYKVGIGLDNPKSMLDIKDTTVQDVIDETTVRIEQITVMNVMIPKFKSIVTSDGIGSSNAGKIMTETSVSGKLYVNTIKHHLALHQINLTTLLAKDITVIYHPLYTHWNGKTYDEILDSDPLNYDLIQNAIIHLQTILDNEMIYNDNTFAKLFKHNTYGYKNVLYKYFNYNNSIYMFMCATTILNYNLNYGINVGISILMETRQCIGKMACELYRRTKNIVPLTNAMQGLSSLKTLMQTNNQIRKQIYKLKFNFDDSLFNPDNIRVWNPYNPLYPENDIFNMNWSTIVSTTPNTIDKMDLDTKQKTINLVNAIITNYKKTELQIGSVVTNVYDDNNYDYITAAVCYDVSLVSMELIVVEFCIQDAISPSLNVTGDTKIKGDLMIVNNNTGQNFVSIDPDQSFFGINTDERNISYRDIAYTTTTSNLYNAKYQVHVHGRNYPIMVSERIQENIEDITKALNNTPIMSASLTDMAGINTRYFGTNTAFTVKRKSDLFTFDEIVKCSNEATRQNIERNPTDRVTQIRYGTDISFEVCDNTNRSVELLNVQATIDSITEYGILKGGFSVQVNDITPSNNNFEYTRRNLMYVNNSGTMFINKINLNGVNLENIGGNLYWGGKRVLTA